MDFLGSGSTPCDIFLPSIHNQELLWVAFIAWLIDFRRIRMATGKHYLYGIQSLLLEAGHHVPILRFKQVRRALKAWGRREGPIVSNPKLPVTVALLRSAALHFLPRDHADRVIWAMMTLGVYGLLRCGELTQDLFDATRYPRYSDWSLHEAGTIGRYYLSLSKTDVTFQGTHIYVSANSSPTCPVTSMQAMILLAPFNWSTSSPLFSLDGIRPISRTMFLSRVRKILSSVASPSDISGHSFRRGGAQSLYDAGLPLDTIRDMGRWKSDLVMRRYYGFSASKLHSISTQLATTSSSRLLNFHTSRGPTKG